MSLRGGGGGGLAVCKTFLVELGTMLVYAKLLLS